MPADVIELTPGRSEMLGRAWHRLPGEIRLFMARACETIPPHVDPIAWEHLSADQRAEIRAVWRLFSSVGRELDNALKSAGPPDDRGG